MSYQVSTEARAAGAGKEDTVYILSDPATGRCAEFCPSLGFNCFRWQVPHQGQLTDLLYADPQLLQNRQATRSGIPVLFPFPNRIRGAQFSWAGREYHLPINDPQQKNAIHGFTPRRPWRVIAQAADRDSASISAEFHGRVDAPDVQHLWPADYRIRLTYRLTADRLCIEARVDNPDRVPLPFGLGYHPYFRVPLLGETDGWVEAPARAYWELAECLPTGACLPVDARRDLQQRRRFSELTLDDVLTDLGGADAGGDTLRPCGCLRQLSGGSYLRLFASPAFRELVAFTPPHRHAIALEPYTCATDAINLQQRGIDAGLIVLEPGAVWTGVVEMRHEDGTRNGA